MPKSNLHKIENKLKRNVSDDSLREDFQNFTAAEKEELKGIQGAKLLILAQEKRRNAVVFLLLIAGVSPNYPLKDRYNESYTPFTKAVSLLDHQQVRFMLNNGVDLLFEINGVTVLQAILSELIVTNLPKTLAEKQLAESQAVPIFQTILTFAKNNNTLRTLMHKNPELGSPLYKVVYYGFNALARLFLAFGANPNQRSCDVYPLMVASEHLNAESLRILLEAGAKPELGVEKQWQGLVFSNAAYDALNGRSAKGNHEQRTLTITCADNIIGRNNVEIFSVLYTYQMTHVDESKRDQLVTDWFVASAFHGSVAVMEFLIDKVKDINAVNCNGEFALQAAARAGRAAAVDFLLQYRVVIKKNDYSVIDVAYMAGFDDIAAKIMEYAKQQKILQGEDICCLSASTIHMAVFGQKNLGLLREQIREYKQCGRPFPGEQLLSASVYSGRFEEARILVDVVPSLEVRNKNQTLLYWAICNYGMKSFQHAEIAELLLSKGADVNSRNGDNDDTPLHRAAMKEGDSSLEAMKLLLKHGADVNALADGMPPLVYACLRSVKKVNYYFCMALA